MSANTAGAERTTPTISAMCAFWNDCLIDAIDAELNSAVKEVKQKSSPWMVPRST
jgi:hypothetical protein